MINKQLIVFWIFWSAIGFLALVCFIYLITHLSPLEFARDNYKDMFFITSLIGAPIAILLTLFKRLKNQTKGFRSLRIFLTIVAAIVGFVLQIFIAIAGMFDCGIISTKAVYNHNFDDSTKICKRVYSCGGAWDGENYQRENLYQIDYFTPFFLNATPIIPSEIDPVFWTKINSTNN